MVGVPMNKTQPFKQHHITRAFRAAAAAGVHDPAVEVRLADGTTIVIGPKASMGKPASETASKPVQGSRKGGRK
jgi:hypothetical protein